MPYAPHVAQASSLWRVTGWKPVLRMMGILVILLMADAARADTIESTSGALIQGKVVARDDKFITMDVVVGGKPVQRKFALTIVKAVTINGEREILQGPGAGTKTAAPAGAAAQRTRQEVEALIAEAGRTPPDWLESTQLNLPKTLDLTWPEKPPPPWNNQKNVGQFVWDVINPNPNRWREGIKLMQKLADDNKVNPEVRQRAIGSMGGMYHHLLQDYARAAYWLRQAGPRQDVVALAECYWKLGNKAMAVELLGGLRQIPMGAIKLWADLGETDKALGLVRLWEGSPAVDEAYVNAGDACRTAGRFPQATQYYQKVMALKDENNNKRSKDRAKAALDAIRLFDTLDVKKVADGAYTDTSMGYEGPLEVQVTVRAGRIEDVKVTKHKEKQFYAAMTDTPAQIIRKQSVKGVDATSRATITSEAIINATAKALGQGAGK